MKNYCIPKSPEIAMKERKKDKIGINVEKITQNVNEVMLAQNTNLILILKQLITSEVLRIKITYCTSMH